MGKKSSAKVKVMKTSASSDEDVKQLNKMFAQITGTADADREVLLPKLKKVSQNVVNYIKLFNILLGFTPFIKQFEETAFWFDEIKDFLTELQESTKVDMNMKDDIEPDYYQLNDKNLNKLFKDLIGNDSLKKIIITSNNLVAFKSHLSDANNLSDTFVNREPGLELKPLAFSSIDLKYIWNHEDTIDKAKKFILNIIKRAFDIGMDMHDLVTSPNVDIKKFSSVLVDSIAKMKTQIPRCNKAFAIIENSVSTLENNFKTYFRGSVEAGNPNIIIESFIGDIIKEQKADASISYEFKQIISYLKQKSAGNNDPKIKKLFGMLNMQFSSLDELSDIKGESSSSASATPEIDDLSINYSKPPTYS
jgi:hypothetical protein